MINVFISAVNQELNYKIVIADDHQIVLDGLIGIINGSELFNVVGVASNYRETVSELKSSIPDVLLTDLNMPGLNGVDMIKELKLQFPFLKIIVLSMYNQKSLVKELAELKISGYLLKHTDKETLLSSLEEIIVDEKSHFPKAVETQNNRSFGFEESEKFKDTFEQSTRLGKRELEVLNLVAKGLSNQEIADKMFVSIETIYSHRKHMKSKLGLKNNGELAAFAVEYNMRNSHS